MAGRAGVARAARPRQGLKSYLGSSHHAQRAPASITSLPLTLLSLPSSVSVHEALEYCSTFVTATSPMQARRDEEYAAIRAEREKDRKARQAELAGDPFNKEVRRHPRALHGIRSLPMMPSTCVHLSSNGPQMQAAVPPDSSTANHPQARGTLHCLH